MGVDWNEDYKQSGNETGKRCAKRWEQIDDLSFTGLVITAQNVR